MSRYTIRTSLTVLSLVLSGASAMADFGTTITYQGFLKQSGEPFSGDVDMVFELYTAESGGTLLATDRVGTVSVADGLFTVGVDFGQSPFAQSIPLWLEIIVAGQPMSPRQLLTAAPFSLATRGIFVSKDGRVGIGKTNPAKKLDVAGAIQTDDTLYHTAIRNVDGVISTYQVSTRRYMVRATQAVKGTTVPLDMVLFEQLCADEDGCSVVVGFEQPSPPSRISFGPVRLYYMLPARFWYVSNVSGQITPGIDGNGVVEHMVSYLGEVFLTDGTYASFTGIDPGPGVGLLNWGGFSNSTAFVIIDD